MVWFLSYPWRERLRDGRRYGELLWVWLWGCVEMHSQRVRRKAITPDFDWWVFKMTTPYFPKAIKASLLKRAYEIGCYKRCGLVWDWTPLGRQLGRKYRICFLPWTSGILCVAPDNPGDEPRNCKDSPDVTHGSCSKESSNCSMGGMKIIVKFSGLNRDRQSMRVRVSKGHVCS